MQGGGGGGRTDQTGAFKLTNVAPGRYQVQARTGHARRRRDGQDGSPVGAEDVDGLVLITATGAKASGVVVSDSGEPLDFRAQQMQIAARPAMPDTQQTGRRRRGGNGRVLDNWTFELRNLIDARLIRAKSPQGWTLKSVFLNGQDITDVPMEFPPGQTVTGLQVVLTQEGDRAVGPGHR